jgi:hypothetical protein
MLLYFALNVLITVSSCFKSYQKILLLITVTGILMIISSTITRLILPGNLGTRTNPDLHPRLSTYLKYKLQYENQSIIYIIPLTKQGLFDLYS